MALQEVNQEWDKCLSRTLEYTTKGAAAGLFLGLLFFKSKSRSIAYFAGLGIGCSYYECEKRFENLHKAPKT